MVSEALNSRLNSAFNELKAAYLSPQGGVTTSTIPEWGGIYFDIINQHSVQINNSVTDNYIENNTAIQDHIAKSPIVVTLSGIVGELVFTPPTKTLKGLYGAANNLLGDSQIVRTEKLSVIPSLLPPVDNITQVAKNAVTYIEASVERYKKIFQSFTSEQDKQTKLQKIYRRLVHLRTTNTLFTVETPYTTLDNMAIQSITFRQGNENYITDIELSLKQINIASVSFTGANKEVLAKYNEFARAQVENNGKAQGKTEDNNTIIGDWAVKYGADPQGGVRRPNR